MDRQLTWHSRAEKIINRVHSVFPRPEFENWELCEELKLSAVAACEQIQQFSIANENATLLLNQTAYYLQEKAQYAEALPLYQHALTVCQQIHGIPYNILVNILNNLGLLYSEQDDFEQALPNKP